MFGIFRIYEDCEKEIKIFHALIRQINFLDVLNCNRPELYTLTQPIFTCPKPTKITPQNNKCVIYSLQNIFTKFIYLQNLQFL